MDSPRTVVLVEGNSDRETRSLHLLARMPAQRDWTRAAVLRRFISVRSGRKARYAALLVGALEPGRISAPLGAVLAAV